MSHEAIPRALLAKLTSNQQTIRYLESLGESAQAVPGEIEQVQSVAMEANSAAASAAAVASNALRLAEQLAAEQISVAALRGQVSRLLRRVEDLEAIVLGT